MVFFFFFYLKSDFNSLEETTKSFSPKRFELRCKLVKNVEHTYTFVCKIHFNVSKKVTKSENSRKHETNNKSNNVKTNISHCTKSHMEFYTRNNVNS